MARSPATTRVWLDAGAPGPGARICEKCVATLHRGGHEQTGLKLRGWMPPLDEAAAAPEAIAAGKTPQEVESATLDFKEQGRSERDTLKTIADAALRFANASGGVVVVGVADRGSAAGRRTAVGARHSPNRHVRHTQRVEQTPERRVPTVRYDLPRRALLVIAGGTAALVGLSMSALSGRVSLSRRPGIRWPTGLLH